MQYKKFKQLVGGGEKANVDFKIQCDAFHSKLRQPNAELAKDICAMAISPPPRVRVLTECWPKADKRHRGKTFVIIQVGPNARRAFRIARDFIAYDEEVRYRRNEVWIRRGSTSDLATPEEIVRLAKGRPPTERAKPVNNIEYLKLPRDDQTQAMLRDLRTWAEDIGGCLYDDLLVVPVGGVTHVWRCEVSRELSRRPPIWVHARDRWAYEHGFVYLVLGTVYKKALPSDHQVQFKEQWGWFTLRRFVWLSGLPPNSTGFPLVLLALPHIASTEALRGSLSSLVQFLATDEKASQYIRQARDSVNENLRRWRWEGWEQPSGSRRRRKPAGLMERAGTILDLSAGKLP